MLENDMHIRNVVV